MSKQNTLLQFLKKEVQESSDRVDVVSRFNVEPSETYDEVSVDCPEEVTGAQ